MRKGPNLLKLARKEQCLALLNSMRKSNKIDGCVYRVFPSGEVQYLHPKDGVYPEKVNKGRVATNTNMRSIGRAQDPAPGPTCVHPGAPSAASAASFTPSPSVPTTPEVASRLALFIPYRTYIPRPPLHLLNISI